MIIPIDEQYRLAGDALAWTIQKRKPRREGNTWEPIGWYTTLEAAVNGLAARMIRTSEATTLAEALAEVRRIASHLTLALQPQFEVRQDSK